MKKTLMILSAVVALAACSSDESEKDVAQPAEVTLKFSPYEVESMTRAAVADFASRLDVWIYEDGVEMHTVHQQATDDGYATLTVTLDKTKMYTLYAVAHNCNGAANLADGVVSFPDDKVSQSFFYTTTFTPATSTSLNCVMNRIVGMFRIETTDAKPDDTSAIRLTIYQTGNRWNVGGTSANVTDRVATVNLTSTHSDGTVAVSVYVMPDNMTDTKDVDILVETLKSDDIVKDSWTFNDVPIRAGYKTTYRGTLFVGTPTTATFAVSDWNEFNVVNF